MSTEAVKAVMARASTDEDFRAVLQANPDQALSDYELTDQERRALASAEMHDPQDLAELDQRISKGWALPDPGGGSGGV